MRGSMTLGEKQELFARLEADWVRAVFALPGYSLRHGEGTILALGALGRGRRARHVLTGLPVMVEDRVHLSGGAHYNRIGEDWQLFVYRIWVADGSSPHWKRVGEMWEAMHPLCRWGGRFGDANHISLEHEGKK